MKIYKKILGFFALAVLLNPNTLTLDASTFSKFKTKKFYMILQPSPQKKTLLT